MKMSPKCLSLPSRTVQAQTAPSRKLWKEPIMTLVMCPARFCLDSQ